MKRLFPLVLFLVSARPMFAAWTSPVDVSTPTFNPGNPATVEQLWDNWQSHVVDSNGKEHICWVKWNDNVAKVLEYSDNVSGSFSAPQALNLGNYYLYAP